MSITISSLTPVNPSVFAGGSITFAVSATSNIPAATLVYRWQISSNGTSWLDLPNNGGSSITLTNIQATASNDQIRVQISEFTPYSPVTYNYTVTGTGSSAWTFSGSASGNNPSLSAKVSDRLNFAVSSTNNNTFYIKTASVGGTTNTVATGITNNGTQNNTVVWDTTAAAAATYYYISAEHPDNMVGPITLSPAVSTLNSTVYSNDVGFARSLTVLIPPSITVIDLNQPSYTLATGSNLSLTIDASTDSSLSDYINTDVNNVSPIAFQWQQSTDNGVTWTNLSAGTNITIIETLLSFPTIPVSYYKRSVLTLSNISFAQNSIRYRCLVSYTKGGVTASNSPLATNTVLLLVNPQIIILRQPGEGTDTTSTISYNTGITNSGNATLSVNAYTTATTTLSYSWEWKWSTESAYTTIGTAGTTPFRLVAGTTPNSPILKLERVRLSNGTENTTVMNLRVIISGLSGEQSIVSSAASLILTQTAIIRNPISTESIIEDRYGPILNRSSYPELLQTLTISAGVDVSVDTGLKGPITLGWQRQYESEPTFTDVGLVKNDSGTDLPPASSTAPSSAGIHTFTTPALRRSTDHSSKYRLYVTYNSGYSNGSTAVVTTYSTPCTLNVYQTAYIDNDPGNSESFENSIAIFAVTAAPSSGTIINYSWEYSINGTAWSPIVDTSPLLNVSAITFSGYTVTVTCSSHNLNAGDKVYISGVTPIVYNGTFTVSSSNLTATSFQYTVLSIPTSNGITSGSTVHKSPKFSGINTNTLSITTVNSSIVQRYYRCIVSVPNSLSTVQSSFGILSLRSDKVLTITSINDKQVQEYNSVSWTVVATTSSLSEPSYQWQKSTSASGPWTNINNANSSTYEIPSVILANAGFYRCLVTSAGSSTSFSNSAKLQVFPVAINITTNIPTSVTIDEDFPGRELKIVATSTIPGLINYQWEVKRFGTSTFGNAPVGFNQTTIDTDVYRINAPSRTNNNDVYRCKLTQSGNPNTYYTNECTITVDRIFNYYADIADKKVTEGTNVDLSLSPSFTGTDLPSYQWQASTNNGTSWLPLTNGMTAFGGVNVNVNGVTTSVLLLSSITSALNNVIFRCAVTLNQVTKVTFYRSSVQTIPISPAGNLFYTQQIKLSVSASVPLVATYTDQRQKVGAAIGTVICVPKPFDYVENPAATTDDADRWRVALTGILSGGYPAQGINSDTKPYGSKDRFPGFIEMRGQLLKAEWFPELARILGTKYGGTISSSSVYPNYGPADLFRLPCPYGKYLLGTGNIDNNKSSASVFPLYAPDGTSGGQINVAGSMGGEYNFEKQDQLSPGNPGISGQIDGTAPTVSPLLFTVGIHKTDGWENCNNEVETAFIGNTSYKISDSSGISKVPLSGPPPHSHTINAIIFVDANKVNGKLAGLAGRGQDCRATQSFSAGGSILDGPEGVLINTRNPSRTHSHTLSFDPNDSSLGGSTGVSTPPPSSATVYVFPGPGSYSFTVPNPPPNSPDGNLVSFKINHYSGSGGGGGNDAANPGSGGGAGGRIVGTVKNIPGGSLLRVIVPMGGGGGRGCIASAPGGASGESFQTGFGGGFGGISGKNGCSGSGGGGGGAALMFCDTVGPIPTGGSNPAGLAKGTILYIVGGGGGGGGSGWHQNVPSQRFNGEDTLTTWASTAINSDDFYLDRQKLDFTDWGVSTTLQYGRSGANRSGSNTGNSADVDDGGGGGGGGGGYRGGAGGIDPGADINAQNGRAGTSAYNASFFDGPPSLFNGVPGGARGGGANDGNGGSATIEIITSSAVPGTSPSSGGVNSPDHNDNWGVIRGSSNQFLSESINHHFDPTSTLESLSISLPPGTVTMRPTSRTAFDNNLKFYLRNNESIPLQQPYFRLKYLIKAF
jgi:hypothetical protein